MRILLDNDVVLDYILNREKHFPDTASIFRHLDHGTIDVFVSSITPVNVFYTTRKEKGLENAKQAVKFLLDTVQFCPTDRSVLLNAQQLGFSDYEDAVQCASAIAENLDGIVTRNTKDFKNSPIPVYSPAEFLAALSSTVDSDESDISEIEQ